MTALPAPDGSAPPPTITPERILAAVMSMAGREVAIRLVSFVGSIILARLLEPVAFGLYAIASFAVNLCGLFTSLGVGAAFIRKPARGLCARSRGAVHLPTRVDPPPRRRPPRSGPAHRVRLRLGRRRLVGARSRRSHGAQRIAHRPAGHRASGTSRSARWRWRRCSGTSPTTSAPCPPPPPVSEPGASSPGCWPRRWSAPRPSTIRSVGGRR